MKYPQPVSTRAVNAISDWLVSRLEQLGVEAPQIYTRLLLSLLQSSVHLNDPIEFSSLETFIVNRKGGGSIRRYLQFDANTLKKLNAIQCLSEIVSPEQELTSIESLVDELWEKLKDIEKQIDRNVGIDDTILIDAPLNKSKATANIVALEAGTACSPKRTAIFCKNLNNEKASTVVVTDGILTKCETETDPKKRYFNAFPALSKEMEDSFRIWRQNAKSLTWPVNRGSNSSAASVNQDSSSIMATAYGSDGKTAEALKNDELLDATNLAAAAHLNNFHNHAIVTSTSGLKRKTKRRKSQSMSKGRTMPNIRKGGHSYNDSYGLMSANQVGRKPNRHLSPTQWDTDFDGYWEMGRDLIKEFFAKQGDRDRGRNRCNSEGSVHQQHHHTNENEQKLQAFEFNELAMNCNKPTVAMKAAAGGAQTPQLMPQVDISFCYDENADDDDTYKSISELTADSSLNTSRSSPRRLYQRLVIPESIDHDQTDNIHDDHKDFLQFKAKFNSNIAALWHDADRKQDVAINDQTPDIATAAVAADLWSPPSNIPFPTVEPIKENFKNFWSIFNNHPMDFAKILQQQQQKRNETSYQQLQSGEANNACGSLPFDGLTTSVQDDNANFICIPTQLDGLASTANDAVNNKRRHDGRNTPVGVFLQDSIWSENLNGGKNTDTDESFYLKVWNSNKKLYNLDAVYEAKLTETSDDSKINSSSSSASFQYYGNSKWSEGINVGPTNPQHQQQQLQQLKISNKEKRANNAALTEQNVNSVDCVDASMPTTASSSSCSYMLSSSGVFSGQTPSLQSSQQSWHADKKGNGQKSLTDMYGISSPSHNDGNVEKEEHVDQIALITLPNHSSESSGFSDYARIKSMARSLGQDNIKQQQLNYQAQLPVVKEQPRYADDENLLTSERTHFQPIKAYADGYTFDVCSALDVINYRRSESGYLYYDSHKYLEYTRNDSYMAEDTDANAAVSAAPLYAGSNCEAAVARKQRKERKADELILKFRIMNREIACQTDDEETVLRRNIIAAQMHPLYLIFSGASTDGFQIPTTGQACSNAIEALNRAVAAAAQAAAERERLQVDRPWASLHEIVGSSRNTSDVDQSHLWTRAQAPPHEEIGGDEIDFCNESSCVVFGDNALEQQWSMPTCQMTIGDICCLAAANDGVDGSGHSGVTVAKSSVATLWGCCAACEYKEAPPANDLLRDELNLEADQIMSDLKNMQDLYIGAENVGNEEDFENELDWQGNGGKVNEGDGIAHPTAVIAAANKSQLASGITIDNTNETFAWDIGNDLELRQKETQQKVLQQVNKLIANLMRPERANDTNVLADAAASAHRELGESLWPDDGEHSIWKNRNESESEGSGSFGCNNTTHEKTPKADARSSVLRAEEKQFLAQLTWEHDNLAELWSKQTPPRNTPPQQQAQQPQEQPPPYSLCSASKSVAEQNVAKSCAVDTAIDQQKNEDNQTKEISKCAAVSAPDINSCSVANYKRIQQFLNSTGASNPITTAKLKLANRKRRHSASQNYAILHGGLVGGATAAISNQKSNTFSATISSNNNNNNNNNNNFQTSDLNNVKRNQKLCIFGGGGGNSLVTADATLDLFNTSNTSASVFSDDVDMEQGLYDPSTFLIINNNHHIGNADDIGVILPPPKQTIITCKYWAAIDPMMDSTEDSIDCTVDDVDVGAGGGGTATATFSCLVDKNDSLLKHVSMLTRPLTR